MSRKKEYNYFEAFTGLTTHSHKLAIILHETMLSFDHRKLSEKVKEAHQIEHSADLARHDIMNRLGKEFLPPIEREDIVNLTQEIDNVTDSLENVLIHIDMYHIKTLRPEVIKLTETLIPCSKAMDDVLAEFKNFKNSKKLHEKIVEVNRLQEEGSSLCVTSIKKLYQTTKEPIELRCWTEIYQQIEFCFKNIENVANVVERVVMKNT
jgi:predicted phosphate transport protein (TIGR00153 family)